MRVRLKPMGSPVAGLSSRALILQIFRLIMASYIIAIPFVLLIGPLRMHNVYVTRINCAHLDVSYGLYKSLRSSVELAPPEVHDSHSESLPVDSTLTNSEISLLTEYAETQVGDTPQYILSSNWIWCTGNYNTTLQTNVYGEAYYKKQNTVVTCEKGSSSYIFDYRRVLEKIGLESVLAYAFQSSTYRNHAYDQKVEVRLRAIKLAPGSIIFSGVSQVIIVLLGLVLYSCRGGHHDLSESPKLFLNAVALLSLACFISSAIVSIVLTKMFYDVQKEVYTNLGAYGVTFHLGKIWFSLLWTYFICCFASAASWTLPLWCANPKDDIGDEDTTAFKRDMSELGRRNTVLSKISNHSLTSGIVSNPFGDPTDLESTNGVTDKKGPDDYEFQEELFNNSNTSLGELNNEDVLRRLGRSFSKKSSVRHLRTSKRSRSNKFEVPITEGEALHLLYEESDQSLPRYPRLYREQTYNGYTDATDSTMTGSFDGSTKVNKQYSSARNLVNPSTSSQPNMLKERHFRHDSNPRMH